MYVHLWDGTNLTWGSNRSVSCFAELLIVALSLNDCFFVFFVLLWFFFFSSSSRVAFFPLPPPPPLSVSQQKRRSTSKARSPGAKVRVTKGKAVGARAAALGAGGGKRSMAYRVKVTPAFSGPLAQHKNKNPTMRHLGLKVREMMLRNVLVWWAASKGRVSEV